MIQSPGMPEDKYVVLEEIGAGTYARVYKGREIEGGQEVAIKVIELYLEENGKPVMPRFDR